MRLRLTMVLGALVLAALLVGVDRESAPPPAAALPADPDLGFSPGAPFLALDDEDLHADLDAIAAVGASWIRLDFDWSHVERQPGVYDWAAIDRVVAAASDRDLAVLGLLAYTPTWARPNDSSDKHPPTDTEDFGTFAAAAAERYGDRVGAWEIWNEPNSALFWEPGPDPQNYAELLVTAVEAIRTEAPDSFIITGGMAPAVDDRAHELSAETFLREVFDHVDGLDVDAVSIHPYSFPALPSDRTLRWSLFAQLVDIRAVVAEQLGPSTTIWLTEYGAPTGSHDRSVTEVEQAELIVDALACAAHLEWLGPMFLYSIRDVEGGRADDMEDNFGLLFADRQPKRAYDYLAGRLEAPLTYGCATWPGEQ